MSTVPDHLISCIAAISSCVLTSSSASSYILPGLSSVLTFQVPMSPQGRTPKGGKR